MISKLVVRIIAAAAMACGALCIPPGHALASETCQGATPVWSNYLVSPWDEAAHWSALAPMLGVHWTPSQIAGRSWFDKDKVHEAAQAAIDSRNVGEALSPPSSWEWDDYRPLIPPVFEDDKQAYANAAKAFHADDWTNAIGRFDQIFQNMNSPYRAAAAYSAARAEIYSGNWPQGIKRVDRLVADPAMREFHMAAHHLIGTLAYQSGAPHMVAARLAEISHLLSAPVNLICTDPQLLRLASDAIKDWKYISKIAFPLDMDDFSEVWTPNTRNIIDLNAQKDELIDILRVLAAPTPFTKDFGWVQEFPPQPSDLPGYSNLNDAAIQAANFGKDELTDHARAQFKALHQPIWAYALARRTADASDLPLLRAAEASLRGQTYPDAAMKTASRVFAALLRAQQIRLLLMSGDTAGALSAIDPHALYPDVCCLLSREISTFIINGGVRYFLEKQDLANARHWATETQNILDHSVSKSDLLDTELALLLTNSWDEFISVDTDITKRRHEFPSVPSAFDILPARKLIELSRRKNLPTEYRRALLSAAWVRLYMLDRWGEFVQLFPDIREAFPELATDLDNIEKAWTDRQKHHLVSRMLLRAPGLGPRVSWERSRPDGNRSGDPHDIFSINSLNASDGNWWCQVDPRRAKIDLLGEFFVMPINKRRGELNFSIESFWSISWMGLTPSERDESYAQVERQTELLIAWHPLFRDADFNELAALSKAPNGPRKLSEEAIAWSNESNWFTRLVGFDNFLPETLHLAVRSTRYGCRIEGGHGEYSRAAYSALHKMFPNSEWSAKTKYWFDGIKQSR